jgi:hypothetical protein
MRATILGDTAFRQSVGALSSRPATVRIDRACSRQWVLGGHRSDSIGGVRAALRTSRLPSGRWARDAEQTCGQRRHRQNDTRSYSTVIAFLLDDSEPGLRAIPPDACSCQVSTSRPLSPS